MVSSKVRDGHSLASSRTRELPDKFRLLFEKLFNVCRRYSLDLDECTSPSELRGVLEAELEHLKDLDSYIALRLALDEGREGFNLEQDEVFCFRYFLADPSPKDLNDNKLGYQGNNYFVADLQRVISQVLMGKDTIEVGIDSIRDLKAEDSSEAVWIYDHDFRGGSALVSGNKIPTKPGEDVESVLKARFKKIQEVAKKVLIKHVQFHMEELTDQMIGMSLGGEVPAEIKKAQTLYDSLEKYLDQLCSDNGEMRFVHVSFGDRPLTVDHKDPEKLYRAMVSASFAASFNALRTNPLEEKRRRDETGGDLPYERSHWQRFNYPHMLRGLIQIREDLEKEVLDVDGILKAEWEDLFYIDEDDNVRMDPVMLSRYRKDKLRFIGNDGTKFGPKMKFFARYAQNINVIDYLKSFRLEDLDVYLERVDRIAHLARCSRDLIDTRSEDSSELLRVITDVSDELMVSIREAGIQKTGVVMMTIRAFISELMTEIPDDETACDDEEGDGKQVRSIGRADFRGLGNLQYLELEGAVIEVRCMLDGISGGDEITIITEKVAEVGEDNLAISLLSGGDKTTLAFQNAVQAVIAIAHECEVGIVIDANSGDEFNFVVTGTRIAIALFKEKVKSVFTLRVAMEDTKLQLGNLLNAPRVVDLSHEQRSPLSDLVRIFARLEEKLEDIKAGEAIPQLAVMRDEGA